MQFNQLPHNRASQVIGKQILRAETSVGANYRAACRARSRTDFISKITIVEDEADESAYWLELLQQSNSVHSKLVQEFHQDAPFLTAIFTASGRSIKIRNLQWI